VNARRALTLAIFVAAALFALFTLDRDAGSGAPAAPARQASADVSSAERRDLAADEARGGHTLDRHVGRSDDELRRRLAEERGISAASTFTDRATAERVVGATLAREAGRVARWLSGGGGNLTLDYRGSETIGRTLERGARQPVATPAARVVLRRGGGPGERWFVLTAYPVEPR
jgi:hypothetical protein